MSAGTTIHDQSFRVISDEAMFGIVILKKSDLGVVYMNSRSREILEIVWEEGDAPVDIASFFCEGMEEFECFSENLLRRNQVNQDVWMKTVTGRYLIARARSQQINSEGQDLVMLMIEDATFEKKLEREIRTKQENLESMYQEVIQQNEALKALDKAKDKFMALTTHELRTPLSAIVATLDVVAMKMYDSQEQLDDFVKSMVTEANNLMAIVNDILDMAKIQAGKMEFFCSQQDIRQLVQDKAAHFQQMAAAKNVVVDCELGEVPVLCYFDELRLGQVVSNIINNAIKFNNMDGRVVIRQELKDGCVVVSIADTGKGIPPDKAAKVFNEFETVGSVDTHQKGTGLGMPISKRLMEAMGGKIYFESEVGQGTKFYLEIPVDQVLAPEMYGSRAQTEYDLLNVV